jgi:DNA-directed RNA polymerase I, II, and III subunit RPABC2
MPRGKSVTSQKRSKSTGSRPSKTNNSGSEKKSTAAQESSNILKRESKDQKKDMIKNLKKDMEKISKGSKKGLLNTTAPYETDNEDSDVELEELEYDAVDEEFFDEKNFKEFNSHIQYRVFDPEQYVSEVHREIIVIPPEYRRTSEVITKFEYTDVTSNRAKQIENGSPVFTDIRDESDPIKMAELEIRMKRCPLSIRRMLSNNICEIWDVNEMIIPY